jgi:cell division protein FtsB
MKEPATNKIVYTKNRISHKKELYYIFCIVAFSVILIFSYFGPGGYREMREARRELQGRQERIDALKRSNEDRVKHIQGLRSSKETLEEHAIRKGYVKEGDFIQRLDDEENEEKPEGKKP